MFEFSRFYPTDYEHGRDFVATLDKFFEVLHKNRPYGIEMRMHPISLEPESFIKNVDGFLPMREIYLLQFSQMKLILSTAFVHRSEPQIDAALKSLI